jgi:hypothetical protein
MEARLLFQGQAAGGRMTRSRLGITALTISMVVASVVPAAAQRTAKRSSQRTSQRAPQPMLGPTASTVASEAIQGRLNPATTKSGDAIVLRLTDDVKSNGEIVIKKGATIVGFVRKMNLVSSDKNSPFIEVEWASPELQMKSSYQVMLAVQAVYQSYIRDESTAAAVQAPKPVVSSGAATPMKTNVALLKMPSVVSADAQTRASLQSALGTSNGSQLFQTGRGQVVGSDGSRVSIDMFSHLNNDTVFVSRAKDFEISTGAQLQLLVGVARR